MAGCLKHRWIPVKHRGRSSVCADCGVTKSQSRMRPCDGCDQPTWSGGTCADCRREAAEAAAQREADRAAIDEAMGGYTLDEAEAELEREGLL